MSDEKDKKPSVKLPTEQEQPPRKDYKAELISTTEKAQSFVSAHIFMFAISISVISILGAVLLAQSYINPERDEQTYSNGQGQTKFREIDQEKLQTLRNSLDESSVDVDTNFVPNRSNPFAE